MYPIFFISYDEPEADEHYERVLQFHPQAKRVHGIKGLYNAHLACAAQCDEDFFYTVDGDTYLVKPIPDVLGVPNHIQRWKTWNPYVNIAYGNASIKLWDKSLYAQDIKNNAIDNMTSISHKKSSTENRLVHYVIKHTQIVSEVRMKSSKHRWRSAFREVVKLYSTPLHKYKRDYKIISCWINSWDDMTLIGANEGLLFAQKKMCFVNNINDFVELDEIWLSKDRSLLNS